MHLVRELVAQLVEPVGRNGVEHPVGLSVLDLGDLGLRPETELLDDHVRFPGRLSVLRPDLEERVPDELDPLVQVVLHELVRTGPRRRDLDCLHRRGGREDGRERHRELLEELRVAARQVERDGVVRVVRDDAVLGEIAGRRRLEARRSADDRLVERARSRAVNREVALERARDVARFERRPVRELDPLAEREDVRLAAFGRVRNGCGEVRNDLGSREAARLLEGG